MQLDQHYISGERYCLFCQHLDDRNFCLKWHRFMPPNLRMTPEHNCPHYSDPIEDFSTKGRKK